MTRLPLSTVQPLRACAAVTDSTVFKPMHTLGQSPAHGIQCSLKGRREGERERETERELIVKEKEGERGREKELIVSERMRIDGQREN